MASVLDFGKMSAGMVVSMISKYLLEGLAVSAAVYYFTPKTLRSLPTSLYVGSVAVGMFIVLDTLDPSLIIEARKQVSNSQMNKPQEMVVGTSEVSGY